MTTRCVRSKAKEQPGQQLDFALLTDGLRAEREQGITIDVAYRYFSTPRRKFIIADTPGHEQYTRNMATGASTADAAIVLVDARKGVLPQSRRHAYIATLLGVRHVIVAVNKMDLVGYDAAIFSSIRSEFENFARYASAETGHAAEIHFIPVSALAGRECCAGFEPDALVRRTLAAGVARVAAHNRAAAQCGGISIPGAAGDPAPSGLSWICRTDCVGCNPCRRSRERSALGQNVAGGAHRHV